MGGYPTATPATAVIAFSGPVGRTPTLIPRSEARGRAFAVLLCPELRENASKSTAAARVALAMKLPFEMWRFVCILNRCRADSNGWLMQPTFTQACAVYSPF